MAVVLVGGAAVLTATLFGLAALWAMRGPASWLWLWSPLVLLLAALAPIGAYELLALYGAQAAVVITALSVDRLRQRWRAVSLGHDRLADGLVPVSPPTISNRPRFHLSDLLRAVVLIGAVFAIVRHAAPSAAATAGPTDWSPWISGGAGYGVVTAAAAWTFWGRVRWYVRGLVFVFVTAIVAGALEGFQVTVGSVQFASPFARAGAGWWALLIALYGLLTLSLLCLSRPAALWWDDESTGRHDAEWTRTKSVWRWPARVMLMAIVPLSLAWLGSAYWALLPLRMSTLDPLPNPNGYGDLVQAGNTLNWAAIPNEDPHEATIEECQAFVQANAGPLSLARQGLAKPCRCPVEFTASSQNINSAIALRSLCRALYAEARVALAANRPQDAVRIDLEIIDVGHCTSRGGLVVDDLIADAIQGMGMDQVTRGMSKLDAGSLQSLRKGLEQWIGTREPIGAVLERDYLWDALAYGWHGRLHQWINATVGSGYSIGQSVADVRERGVAHGRLLIAEAGVRRHVLLEGAPPETFAGLVPNYLAAVPVDPFSDRPLVYRRTDTGYLLYSVGSNRVDDGGQRVSFTEATMENKGDLFFDASDDDSEAQLPNAAMTLEEPASEP